MTHEPQLPKPTSANGSTGKGKRWNPLRIDKPLLSRAATTPPSSLAQPYLSETAEEEDPTAIDSSADSPQGKTKRLPQLPKVVQTVPKVLKKRVGFIRLPNWKVLALIGFFGSGCFAAAALLRSPALPNCPSIFWPMFIRQRLSMKEKDGQTAFFWTVGMPLTQVSPKRMMHSNW